MEHLTHSQDKILESHIDFTDLVNSVPAGICKFLLNDTYTLLYGNSYFFQILGYTPEQFHMELDNNICCTFLSDECNTILDSINECVASGKSDFHVEHRIIRRDKSIIWVLVSGSFFIYESLPAAYGVILDITDRKEMEEQLRIDEERFRIAFAQTDSTIFDYEIQTKVMIHADKSAELYGLTHRTENVPDALVDQKVVHPETASDFLEMYHQIRTGTPSSSCIIQAKKADGEYAWRKISMTNIFDQYGNPVRAVGMLEDIDEQTRREELLLERSEHDILTKVYNKGTTEQKIIHLLEQKNCSGALFIVDIDAFKSINDNYGHLFGDRVLSISAQRISSLCRHGDIVGRIGGDEFLLFLSGDFTESFALAKTNEICDSFRKEFSYHDKKVTITCTVGAALCPKDGVAFENLYQKADSALYHAKRKGKNQGCLYHG